MTPKTKTPTIVAAALFGLCFGWILAASYGRWESLFTPVDTREADVAIYDAHGRPLGWE